MTDIYSDMCDSMKSLQGKQVDSWAGKFGDEYTHRNCPDVPARVKLWADILSSLYPDHLKNIESALEVGAGSGQNLLALRALVPSMRLSAIDPNAKACERLRSVADRVEQCTADKTPFGSNSHDLVFTSGVLIHIPPLALYAACAEMYRVSSRYIVCAEYFAAEPEMKIYRGEAHKMWKRDFGAFWLDNFDLKLIDYGFSWKKESGIDNLTWWAFKKW